MTTKSLIAFLILMLITVGLLIAQNRGAELSNTTITKMEMETWLKSMPPEQLRAMSSQPDAKKLLIDNLKQMFTLAAEAERLGITAQPDVQADLAIMDKVVLASLFRDRKAAEQPKAIEVTEEEREEYFKRNPTAFDNFVAANPRLKKAPEQQREAIKPQFAELMVLVERARQMGLDKDPAYLMGKKVNRADYLARRCPDKIRSTMKVTDEDLRKEYEARKDQMAETRASHILVMFPEQRTSRPGMTKPEDEGSKPKTKEEARALADDLLKRVKGGENFDELAIKYSDDTGSGEKGGDLGFFRSNVNFVPTFKEAVFKLQVNQISEIVETQFGYHIIKVTEKRLAPFEDAKGELEDEILDQKAQDYIKALKDKNLVTVDETFTMPQPPPQPAQPAQPQPSNPHSNAQPDQHSGDDHQHGAEPAQTEPAKTEPGTDKKPADEKSEKPAKAEKATKDSKATDKAAPKKSGK